MKILLAVDDSDVSKAAVREALMRPWPDGSELRIINVVPNEYPLPAIGVPGMGMAPAAVDAFTETQQIHWDQANAMVAALANQMSAAGLIVEGVIRRGDPADRIVLEAGEWGADLILMGSHGRHGLSRVILGSVAQKVLSHAPCSVEVVREHGAEQPAR